MRMPSFTAEVSLGPATGSYRNTTVALAPSTGSTVIPALIFRPNLRGKRIIDVSGGDCTTFCDPLSCWTCCWGICRESNW
jgi:hypothetical protein